MMYKSTTMLQIQGSAQRDTALREKGYDGKLIVLHLLFIPGFKQQPKSTERLKQKLGEPRLSSYSHFILQTDVSPRGNHSDLGKICKGLALERTELFMDNICAWRSLPYNIVGMLATRQHLIELLKTKEKLKRLDLDRRVMLISIDRNLEFQVGDRVFPEGFAISEELKRFGIKGKLILEFQSDQFEILERLERGIPFSSIASRILIHLIIFQPDILCPRNLIHSDPAKRES
ncbi:hypothetical protein Tco_0428334 [Tanacetum coccineum]